MLSVIIIGYSSIWAVLGDLSIFLEEVSTDLECLDCWNSSMSVGFDALKTKIWQQFYVKSIFVFFLLFVEQIYQILLVKVMNE